MRGIGKTQCPARSSVLDTGTHPKCSRSRGGGNRIPFIISRITMRYALQEASSGYIDSIDPAPNDCITTELSS